MKVGGSIQRIIVSIGASGAGNDIWLGEEILGSHVAFCAIVLCASICIIVGVSSLPLQVGSKRVHGSLRSF